MELKCENPKCGKIFEGEEPRMCCNGRDCGCMGRPIDPVTCTAECEQAFLDDCHKAQEEYFQQQEMERKQRDEEEWQQRMRETYE